MSLQLQLPANLLESICFVETRHKNVITFEKKTKDHSIGICQIKLKTARNLGFFGSEEELMKPEVNIFYAGLYLSKQHRRYNNWARAINSYNRGFSSSNNGSEYINKVFNEYIKRAK